jgi:hypothetical protein
MAIAVRFLSGSMEGREFALDKDVIRIGDSADADVRVDPNERDNGGARDRIIEIFRDGNVFRVHSTGNRELSAQGDTATVEDRRVSEGDEIRFGAWGPVFTLGSGRSPLERTNPVLRALDDSGIRKRKDTAPLVLKLPSGETPVGPKTVFMMIQDALGKARETEGGTMQRGTIFIREVVNDTLHSATRSLKIGLALMAGAVLILAAVLVTNIQRTKDSIKEVSGLADRRVAGVKTELRVEMNTLKAERDSLAKEADALTHRLDDVEKAAGGSKKDLGELRSKLQAAERRRSDLEDRLAKAMAAVEADRAALAVEKERVKREQAAAAAAEAERVKAEKERLAREEASHVAAPEPAPEPAPVKPAPATTPPPS